MRSFLFLLSHNRLTGVATFVFTVASQLKRLGHRVGVRIWRRETPYPIAQAKFAAAGLLVSDDPGPGDFENVVCSDLLSLRAYAHLEGKTLFVAHGLGEAALELREPEDVARVDHVFCVSRFMTEHYRRRLPQTSVSFFPNVIDTARFRYADSRRQLTNVLINDRRTSEAYYEHLLAISRRERVLFIPISSLNAGNSIWEMEKILPGFDLVLGYGRSAYEAMSCGRNVIVFGVNGGDGFVTPAEFGPMFERNCSGWGTRKLERGAADLWERFSAELRRFDPEAGKANRRLAVEQLDVERHLDSFLAHCA